MTPAKRLGHILRHKGLTNKELAALAGINESVVSGLLAGTRTLSDDYALQIAEALGEDPTWLLAGEGDPPAYKVDGVHEAELAYELQHMTWPDVLSRLGQMIERRLSAIEARLTAIEQGV